MLILYVAYSSFCVRRVGSVTKDIEFDAEGFDIIFGGLDRGLTITCDSSDDEAL
jgi:hypothetical protein